MSTELFRGFGNAETTAFRRGGIYGGRPMRRNRSHCRRGPSRRTSQKRGTGLAMRWLLEVFHHPDIATLWPVAVKQDPLSIRRPYGIINADASVFKFIHLILCA